MAKQRLIQIYDTSLRDGMQGMEINYTLEDKLEIAQALDDKKIDYIEGGFPLSNEKEEEFFRQVSKLKLKHSKIASFGSTRKPKSDVKKDINIQALLQVETQVVTIVAKTSPYHVQKVLKTSLDENLNMTFESVQYLKSQGREVILDLEHFFDGYKINPDYAIKVLQAGTEGGADVLVLCDTNGGTLVHEVQKIMAEVVQHNLAPIGVHFHNDCELAVANSLMGLEYGAVQIQGTINGWGERAGNANLISIMPNIALKDKRYTANCATEIHHLTYLSRFVADKANLTLDTRQPFVGHAAFTHKAGQHADVLLKSSDLMEQIKPEEVGNERHVILSELAGKSTILTKLSKFGNFSKDDEEVKHLIQILKKKEIEGFEYESAEASFELEILKEINMFTPLFSLKSYHLELYKSSFHQTKSVCRIFLEIDNQEVMGAAVGVGPVEVIDLAIRDALHEKFPAIRDIKIIDYRVRVLNPESSTSAKVRVQISNNIQDKTWSTIGADENIVEASWQALVDSYNYYFNLIHLTGKKVPRKNKK